MWGNLLNSLSPRVGGGSVASALVRFRFWSIPPRSTDIPLRALCLPVARTFLSVRRGAVLFLTPSVGSPYCVGGTNWRHGSPCLQGEPEGGGSQPTPLSHDAAEGLEGEG